LGIDSNTPGCLLSAKRKLYAQSHTEMPTAQPSYFTAYRLWAPIERIVKQFLADVRAFGAEISEREWLIDVKNEIIR
jgi:hypothetical protein